MKKSRLLLAPIILALGIFAKCEKEDAVLTDLPQSIQQYISTNYPGYELDEAEQGTLCTGASVYEVELEKSENEEVELVFDTEGNLLFTETEIPLSALPPAVNSAIDANYAGFVKKEANRLDGANGVVQYEVELKKGPANPDVLFSAEGTVICEETDDDDG